MFYRKTSQKSTFYFSRNSSANLHYAILFFNIVDIKANARDLNLINQIEINGNLFHSLNIIANTIF